MRSFLPFHCAFGPSISFLPRTLSGRTLPLEAQAVGGVESIGLEKKDGNCFLSPLVPSWVSRAGIFWNSWSMENSRPSQHFRVVYKTPKCPLWVLPLSFILFLFLKIFGYAESSLLSGLFSSCGKQGLCYSCSVRVSHSSGFSCCGVWALGPLGFSSCGSWALEHRLDSCDTQTKLFCGMWDLPGSGIEPVSPALAGGFFTTKPPGKPLAIFLNYFLQEMLAETCSVPRQTI